MTQQSLTHKELLEKIRYNKNTGMFYSRQTGLRIGHYDKENGKRAIRIGNKKYQETRLAVLYVTGKWPKGFVKHKTKCKTVTKFSDLVFKLDGDMDLYNDLVVTIEHPSCIVRTIEQNESFFSKFWRWLNG